MPKGGVRGVCTLEGCGRPHCAKGLCNTHYARLSRGLPLDVDMLPKGPSKTVRAGCAIEWCTRTEQTSNGPSKGLCAAHARRQRFGQDMHAPLMGCGSDPVSTFESAHGRVRGLWGSPSQYPCVECGAPARDWAYDGTDSSEHLGIPLSGGARTPCFYSSWPEFYMPMCSKCHRAKDVASRQKELTEYRQWRHRTGASSLLDWNCECSN